MNKLFFDTETTGVPANYKAPITDSANWPRLVQIGWVFVDDDGKQTSNEYIVKPEGFEIPIGASNVHGITTERALAEGYKLDTVLHQFEPLIELADIVIGHNVSFDMSIVGAEFWRLYTHNPFENKRAIDTMKSTVNFCALPGKYGFKYPKLSELFLKLFEKEMGHAHTALADIQNTVACYEELLKRGIISL